MKKLLLLILVAFLGIAASAQTRVTEVTPDGYIGSPSYVYLWGSTADTLTNADTLSFVVRVKGDMTQDFNIQIYNDFVSGTATGKLKTYRSIDGVTYTVTSAADSITVAAVTADILDIEVISISDFNYPYLKLEYIQAATGVNVPRSYIYTKKN